MKTQILVAAVVGVSVGLFFFVSSLKFGDSFIKASVTQSSTSTFWDILPDWASDSINRLSSAGIIKGYADGRFGAADNLTRAQVVTLLYRTLKYKDIIQEPNSAECAFFGNVKSTDYYYLPVCLLTLNNGYTVLNDDPDVFAPDSNVTRGEAAKLIDAMLGDTFLKAMNKGREMNVVFPDVPKDNPYFDNIALVYTTGIMKGNPDGSFNPNRLLNRAEMAVIMDRTLNLMESLEIKELAKEMGEEDYMAECADIIDAQTTLCSGYENWSLDIKVLKQNVGANTSDIEISEMRYGPGNKCSSSMAGETFPADIQSKFLSDIQAGGGEEIQTICSVTCMGWDMCTEDEGMVNKCTGDSMKTSDCLASCDGTCEASADQANCSVCVPYDDEDTGDATDDSDRVDQTNNCGEAPFYDCSQCNGLPSYPTFAYENCLTACQNDFQDASVAYNACLEQE